MNQQISVRMVLLSLMLCTFAIGMTEYVVMGLLTQIGDMFGVSVASTGLIVTLYALSVAVFGPLVTMLTIKWPRKPLLLILLLLFILSNAASALAPTFGLLLVFRVAAGLMHASFFGMAMVTATIVVGPTKQSFAIASIQGGITIAIMLGVPFGSFIGNSISWRIIFWIITAIGILSFLGVLRYVPSMKPAEAPSLRKELRSFSSIHVLLPLATIIFGYAGVFTTYTFIEPMLRQITGVGVTGLTIALFCFGLGAAIGNLLSGKLPLAYLTRGLLIALSGLTLILLSFTFALKNEVATYLIVFLFGMGAFGTSPILQTKMISGAKGAPTLAATTAASAFNVANAGGAWLGGILLHTGFNFTFVSFTGAFITVIGIVLTLISRRAEQTAVIY